MTTPAAPPVVRNWNEVKPLNHYSHDHILENGVRCSTPLYIDLTPTQRKELFNILRETCKQQGGNSVSPTTGLEVVSYATKQPEVEAFLGMTLDVLRGVIFQRGGLQIDLVLRIQAVTGLVLITEKDIAAAFKKKTDAVKSYIKEFQFDAE